MRPYGLVGLLSACASAGAPAEPIDASFDAPGRRDATIEPPSDAMSSACPSTAMCSSAVPLGTVSGDSQNQKLLARGHQSAWFRVRVTEDDSDFPGVVLRVAAKLTSPPGVMFDTFVYVNTGSDAVECSVTTGTKTNTGTTEVRAEWGEGLIPNGNDDGRDVSIEVRPLSTNCSQNAMWQLEIEGNWP